MSTTLNQTVGSVPTAATNRRDANRYYRFALYGRSGSGKTCVLAKIALGANGHRGGLTCERLPVTVAKPDGDPSFWSAAEKAAAALHAGKEWIDEAVTALERGKCPSFNPPIFDRNIPLTVDFQIGSPERGLTLIRTIDYSGELIRPRRGAQSRIADECPQELPPGIRRISHPRRHTPEGRVKGVARGRARRLREAFALLRDDEQFATRTPVAVMFTKWDRYSEIDLENPNSEDNKLRDFIASQQSHRSLVDSVRNTVSTATQSAVSADRSGEPAAAR